MGEEDGDDLDNFDDQATVDMRRRDDRRTRRIDRDLGSIKLKIPSFQGKNDPEAYLEWEKKVELVFDCHNYSEEKKETKSRKAYKNTWEEMKAIMRRRFVPTHYYRELHQRLQSLTEGFRSVEDYHKEMEIIMIQANIEEEREAIMARFLHGLNQDIANLVDLEHYVELEDMVHMAMKVERQLKKKCHIASQFPNKRAMILRDDGDVETESESDDDPMPPLENANDGVEYPVDGKLMVARRALNMQVKVDAETAAVQHLKKITQYPFPLKIPTEGQRILQIDESDEYWGAVLLEKLDGKEAYCDHASGSNDPSPSSPPLTTPIIEEVESDTNPTTPSYDNPPKPSNGLLFTFDNIPKVKWSVRFQEFSTWIDVQMLRTGASSQTVLKEFSSQFTGSLRDWFESLDQYKQLQLVQAEIPQVLGAVDNEDPGELFTFLIREKIEVMVIYDSKRVHNKEWALVGSVRCLNIACTGKISLVAYKTVRHHRYHNSSSMISLEGSMEGKEEFMKITGTVMEEEMRVRVAKDGGLESRSGMKF
ncbi:hypothetical protein KPL70_025949 [Citrus sinensis]|nr:hypothetical protein KPL70_025949 [Citrus sinensis]